MTEIEKMFEKIGLAKYKCEHKIQKYCDECEPCRDTLSKPFHLCKENSCKKPYKKLKLENYFSNEAVMAIENYLLSLSKTGYNSINYGHVKNSCRYQDGYYIHYYYRNTPYVLRADSRKEVLASLIETLWDNLTNQEKEEIRNILK